MKEAYIQLPQLAAQLIQQGYTDPERAPTYKVIYTAILNGKLSAETVNGRYRVRRSQLPQIAELFGLSVQASETAA